MRIQKTWERMTAILMAVLLAFSSVNGSISSFLTAYAEGSLEQQATPEVSMEPSIAPAQTEMAETTPAPEATTEAAPEVTAEATTEATVEATPEATAEATPEVTAEPVAAPTMAQSAIQTAIAADGYAYVRVADAPVCLYETEALTDEMGTLTEKGDLLYAEKYVDRGERTAAVLVCFDTENGEVKGYVREKDLDKNPLTLDDARKTWKDADVRVWLDDTHTKALPMAAFEIKQDVETPVPETPATETPVPAVIEETEFEETIAAHVAVDMANLRAEPNAESALIAQLARGESLALEGRVEINGEIWYRLTYEEQTAYIRSDLVEIIEADVTREPEQVADADQEYVLTDAESGVSVHFTAANLPEGVMASAVGLRVTRIDAETLAAYCAQLGAEVDSALAAWDVSLYDTASGDEIQPVGGVKVTMDWLRSRL